MFGSTTTSTEHSIGNLFATKPFGMTTTFGSPFGMLNSSGTTTGMIGTASSTFPSTTTFNAASSPAFGGSATAFGRFSSVPAPGFTSSGFGESSVIGQKPAFGASSTATVGVSSTPTLGHSITGFGSRVNLNETGKFSFGAQNFFTGSQVTTATFGSTSSGQPDFGYQKRGSRIATYTKTNGIDTYANQREILVSISGMPVYKDKSHEELRCEDYLFGDKGGIASYNLKTNSNTFSSSSASMVPFSTSTSNMFASPVTSSVCINNPPFSSSSFSNFLTQLPSSTSVTLPTLVSGLNNLPPFSYPCSSQASIGSSISHASWNPSSSPAASSSLAFQSTPFTGSSNSTSVNPFCSTTTPSTASGFSSFSSLPLTSSFTTSSCTPSTSVTVRDCAFSSLRSPISISAALSVNPASTVTPSIHFPSQEPSYRFPSPARFATDFNSPTVGGSSLANSSSKTSAYTPATLTTSTPPLFLSSSATSIPTSPPEISPGLSFTNTQPSQLLNSSLPSPSPPPPFQPNIRGINTASGQNAMAQAFDSQTTAVGQLSSGVNPFGSLPPIPKMLIDGQGSSPTVQYGISSLSVQNKPAPVRATSLLTVRHLSRRIKMPVQKYDPKNNGPKVPFFSGDNEMPITLFVPRENPRALVIRPTEQWPLRADSKRLPEFEEKLSTIQLRENGENSIGNVPNLELADGPTKVKDSPVQVLEDIEALLPKLQLSGYYTEPRIEELAANERKDQGFCNRVKNFVVGRHGYGSIMFTGETDVQKLDLESCVRFNNREVIVYMDESKKPPVGQGLNKPAEVTLLNIKCTDKKTGKQWIDGPKIDKYREMLMKKAAEQGAEFVSFDPVGGEWKFRVQHF